MIIRDRFYGKTKRMGKQIKTIPSVPLTKEEELEVGMALVGLRRKMVYIQKKVKRGPVGRPLKRNRFNFALCAVEYATLRNKLVMSNLRLIGHKIKKYTNNPGMEDFFCGEIADLVSVGFLALYEAADRFDPRSGRFSTYADFWIRAFFQDYFKMFFSVVHVPDKLHNKAVKFMRAKRKLNKEYSGPVDLEKAAFLLNIEASEAVELMDIAYPKRFSINQVLNDGEDEEREGKDVFVDEKMSPEELLETKDMLEKTARTFELIFARLAEDERRIMKKRFGYFGKRFTLEEVGMVMGAARGSAHYFENKVIAKIRKEARKLMSQAAIKFCANRNERPFIPLLEFLADQSNDKNAIIKNASSFFEAYREWQYKH